MLPRALPCRSRGTGCAEQPEFKAPEGLTERHLDAYEELASNALFGNKVRTPHTVELQNLRLEIIREVRPLLRR